MNRNILTTAVAHAIMQQQWAANDDDFSLAAIAQAEQARLEIEQMRMARVLSGAATMQRLSLI
jgi:hypothetical protein